MAQFARKWRPRQFEDVVGQELVVSLLRNTLYRDALFPVYLFAGQRGCGKTTLGRIFAAAVNCEKKVEFTQNPRDVIIPCRACHSCQAMNEGSHTDFHEIDAASHTGVDHVRTLLDASILAPQLGNKRIYLIDEVHMLSKAACNALLKTLEEPLDSVLFLLATTDPHKIIDTVRSRCFQLFLKPLTTEQIIAQLIRICEKERIAYDKAGLLLITSSAEGSLRDAINILERIVTAYGRVDETEVPSLLGMISPSEILDLCEALAAEQALTALTIARGAPMALAGIPMACRMLCEIFRALVWLYHGTITPEMVLYETRLRSLLKKLSLERIMTAWNIVHVMEQRIVKSTHPQAAWELTLVQLCSASYNSIIPLPPKNHIENSAKTTIPPLTSQPTVEPNLTMKPTTHTPSNNRSVQTKTTEPKLSGEALWNQVLAHMQNPQGTASEPQIKPKAQRVQAPPPQSVVHDDITKKMLALFPGTLTQEFEEEKK